MFNRIRSLAFAHPYRAFYFAGLGDGFLFGAVVVALVAYFA